MKGTVWYPAIVLLRSWMPPHWVTAQGSNGSSYALPVGSCAPYWWVVSNYEGGIRTAVRVSTVTRWHNDQRSSPFLKAKLQMRLSQTWNGTECFLKAWIQECNQLVLFPSGSNLILVRFVIHILARCLRSSMQLQTCQPFYSFWINH